LPLLFTIFVAGFWLIPYLDSLTPADKKRVLADVMALLADGTITPYSGTKMPLSKVRKPPRLFLFFGRK
jgi:hypothetical protein